MEKRKKHLYEFDILEKDIVSIEKGMPCELFPGRIQGSNACLNCTYSKADNVSDNKLRSCKCVRSFYSDKHHEVTIDTIRKCDNMIKDQAKSEEQKIADKHKEVREFLLKNGLLS